ncbi:MAG: MerR family transcriptional regulator [Bacteriovoracia bacterium]
MSIPQKSAFKFGELTSITGVKPYVLRFWETEFEEIQPVLGEDGQKVYSRVDVELILKIKSLLFDGKMSLLEAKSALKNPTVLESYTEDSVVSGNQQAAIETLVEGLTLIKALKAKHRW